MECYATRISILQRYLQTEKEAMREHDQPGHDQAFTYHAERAFWIMSKLVNLGVLDDDHEILY